jgi:hypothetical protein
MQERPKTNPGCDSKESTNLDPVSKPYPEIPCHDLLIWQLDGEDMIYNGHVHPTPKPMIQE